MSFKINWPTFSPEWLSSAQTQLETALNKGGAPAMLAGPIAVQSLSMGTRPPALEVLEVGELEATGRFRGIFKLVYEGDGALVLGTKVQANPLGGLGQDPLIPPSLTHSRLAGAHPLAAQLPLIVPMTLSLSSLRLRGIVVLVIDARQGVTLSFKSDPLESIHVQSTFDGIPAIKHLLQTLIEVQLRKLFAEDLPLIVHNLSLLWVAEKQQQQQSASSSPERLSSIQSTSSITDALNLSSYPGSGLSSSRPAKSVVSQSSHYQTHDEKWSGNHNYHHPHHQYQQPYPHDIGAPTILYKSISTPQPQEGLGNVFGHPLTFSREQVLPEDHDTQVPSHSRSHTVGDGRVDVFLSPEAPHNLAAPTSPRYVDALTGYSDRVLVEDELWDKVTLSSPEDTVITSQLANLMNRYHSIAPPPGVSAAGLIAMRSDPATAVFGFSSAMRGLSKSSSGILPHRAINSSAATDTRPPTDNGVGQGVGSWSASPRPKRRLRRIKRHVIRLPSQLTWQPLVGSGSSGSLASSDSTTFLFREGARPGTRVDGLQVPGDRSQSVSGDRAGGGRSGEQSVQTDAEDGQSVYTVL